MREPRPTQRFPTNGKDLYEALRRDAEPVIVWVIDEDDLRQCNVVQDFTLIWNRYFDPMLYFWPVEHQHVVAIFWSEVDEKLVARLVKALLRDGSGLVTVSQPSKKPALDAIWTTEDRTGRRRENYGDVHAFIKRHRPDLGPT